LGGGYFFIIVETDFLNQIDTSEPGSFYTFFVDTHIIVGTINGYDWFIYYGKLIQQLQ